MTEKPFKNPSSLASLVNMDSPDDFPYEGNAKSEGISGAKNVKGFTKNKENFTRIDNPDDIDANISKK